MEAGLGPVGVIHHFFAGEGPGGVPIGAGGDCGRGARGHQGRFPVTRRRVLGCLLDILS